MISTAIVNITETMIALLIMNIITMIMAKGGGGRKHIVWRSKGSGGSCAGGLSGKKSFGIKINITLKKPNFCLHFQDKDVYLIDDIFSAVDGHVAAHIYRKVAEDNIDADTEL